MQINPIEKKCYRCQKTKELNEFNKSVTGAYGYSNRCRKCENAAKEYNQLPETKKRVNLYMKKKYQDKEYREKILEINRERRKKEQAKIKSRIQRKKWRKKPQNKIACNLRCRIYHVLKGISKIESTELLTGCSFIELKKYLESLLLPGMTWENYGEWHIDHIKPCASFDLTDENQQRECFHFSNLQPLWAKDNISKG